MTEHSIADEYKSELIETGGYWLKLGRYLGSLPDRLEWIEANLLPALPPESIERKELEDSIQKVRELAKMPDGVALVATVIQGGRKVPRTIKTLYNKGSEQTPPLL